MLSEKITATVDVTLHACITSFTLAKILYILRPCGLHDYAMSLHAIFFFGYLTFLEISVTFLARSFVQQHI